MNHSVVLERERRMFSKRDAEVGVGAGHAAAGPAQNFTHGF
jgi:hypothetical protein